MRLETVTALMMWTRTIHEPTRIARTKPTTFRVFGGSLTDAEISQNRRSGLSTPRTDRWPCLLRPHILRRRRDFPGPRILQSFDFHIGQGAPLARRQEFIIQKTDADSLQLGDRMPNRIEHAADLLIPAL